MPLPDEHVAQVERSVAALNASMPAQVRAQLRYEIETGRNALTIVETRSVDPLDPSGEWFRVLCARVRFTRSVGWQLYWPDRDSVFHRYQNLAPSWDVGPLLKEIDEDPTDIFFG